MLYIGLVLFCLWHQTLLGDAKTIINSEKSSVTFSATTKQRLTKPQDNQTTRFENSTEYFSKKTYHQVAHNSTAQDGSKIVGQPNT